MQFWQNVLLTSGMAGSLHWLMLGFVVAAVLLFKYQQRERTRVRAAAFLFALSLAGLAVGGTMLFFVPATHSVFITVRGISQFLEAVAIINLAGVFLFAVLLTALRLQTPRIMQDLLTGIAYVVTMLVVLSGSGIDLRGIVATSAVMTAVIGFSLQDTLGNIMAGMAVQMDRTIRAGDWIRVDQIEGQVVEIRWRQTSIETRDWDTVVLPNSMLMKGPVTLLGRRTALPVQQRRWIHFNVDFRRSTTEVIQVVEKALNGEVLEGVAAEPKPHCLVTSFMDSYVTYAARYWLTDLARPDPADSLVRTRIFAALRRAGIPLSIPAHAVFLTEDDEGLRERKKSEQMKRRVTALEALPLLRSLTDEERRQLATRLKSAPFIMGEALTRQGAKANWLYMIVEGEVDVHVDVDGQSQKVATLKGGDFFGEMGIMTGEPRSATVLAKTDVKCYRLGEEDFEDIMHQRPEIAEDIADTLARRRVELDSVREGLSEEARAARVVETQGALLSRIRDFFNLGG